MTPDLLSLTSELESLQNRYLYSGAKQPQILWFMLVNMILLKDAWYLKIFNLTADQAIAPRESQKGIEI